MSVMSEAAGLTACCHAEKISPDGNGKSDTH